MLTPCLQSNVERVTQLGVSWHFTQVTVCTPAATVTETQAAQQAALYAGLMDVCVAVSECTVFQLGGFVDGWGESAFAALNAYPFDKEFEGKVAFEQIMEKLDELYGVCLNEGENCRVGGIANACCDERTTCFEKGEYVRERPSDQAIAASPTWKRVSELSMSNRAKPVLTLALFLSH